jgi:hypothetical protein
LRLHRLTAPLFTTLLRGVYQIIQTNAQLFVCCLFVLACSVRSGLPVAPTPKIRSPAMGDGASQILWNFDRATPFARSGHRLSSYAPRRRIIRQTVSLKAINLYLSVLTIPKQRLDTRYLAFRNHSAPVDHLKALLTKLILWCVVRSF